jgi:X-X-X-Leu-X-X-Gly heptad repeat protein
MQVFSATIVSGAAELVSGAAELHQVKNLARQSSHLAGGRAKRTEKEKAQRSRAF